MASNIEWTNETWNPIVGCSKVSPGCANCYAERMAWRLAKMGQTQYRNVVGRRGRYDHDKNQSVEMRPLWNGRTAFVESAIEKPLHWKRSRMIFVCSMGDLFHESVPFEWTDQVFAVMALCPQHTFQVLTKRPDRMKEYFTAENRHQPPSSMTICNGEKWTSEECVNEWAQTGEWNLFYNNQSGVEFPLSNVWLGVTAENQEMADERIPTLLSIPAAVRFVSCEPLLGKINDLEYWLSPTGAETCSYGEAHKNKTCECQQEGLDWVIVGAESGPGRRRCSLGWVNAIVDQCEAAGVACYVKQISDGANRIIKKPSGYPQEFPV